MRWPWVSRARFDEVGDALIRERERADAANTATAETAASWMREREKWTELHLEAEGSRRELIGRNYALTQEIERLVAQVEALTPKPAPVTAAPTAREKSPIAEAIAEEAAGDPRLARYYREKLVPRLRKEGKGEADIIAAIHAWETTESSTVSA